MIWNYHIIILIITNLVEFKIALDPAIFIIMFRQLIVGYKIEVIKLY